MLGTLDKIHYILKTIATNVTIANTSGLEDMAKVLENLTKSLFRVLDHKEFGPPTPIKCNQETIEFSATDGTEYQVTTNKNFKEKCERTINAFLKNKQEGHTLQIVYFSILTDSDKRTKENLIGKYQQDITIYDIQDICKKIEQCDIETLDKIYDVCYIFCPIDFSKNAVDNFTIHLEQCDNYIERTFNILNENLPLTIENANDLLKDYVRIVVMADASAGKTELLKKINNNYFEKGRHVYYFQLKNYLGDKISSYIPSQFLLFLKPLLLLDGFDEIKSIYVEKFISELNIFTQLHPDCNIIITSRKNFCHPGMFDNFSYSKLNDLTDAEIEQYFKTKFGQEYFNKIKLCKDLNIYDLLYNPFYLTRIVSVLNDNSNLSNRSDIMKATFKFDYNKYKFKTEISSQDLLTKLKKFAWFLFKNDKNSCDIIDYEEFDDDTMRAFPWLLFQDDQISFVHNNFKEYLVALYLNEIPFSKLKKLITTKLDKTYIKIKYTNVLSFLLSIYKNHKLFNYVLRYGQYIIIDLEEISLTEKQKIQIIEQIYNEYELKKSWPNACFYNETKLAKICDNRKIVEILISKLKTNNHRTTIVFTIDLLKEVPSLYDFTNDLKIFILQWLNDGCQDETVLSSLIYFLPKLNISVEEASNIYSKYRNYNRSRVRASANYLLKEYKLTSRFIPEVIEGYNKGQLKVLDFNHSDDDIIDAGENYFLQQAIGEVADEKALEELLNHIIASQKSFRENSIAECVFKAIENKSKLNKTLKEQIYIILCLTCKRFAEGLVNLTLEVINKYKLNGEYICKVFSDSDINEHEKAQLIARLCTDESIIKCVNGLKFKSKEIRDDFIYYLKQYNKDFKKAYDLFNKENIPCSLPQNNYEIERRKIAQTNFDKLFYKSKVVEVIKKIIKDLNGDDISKAKVREYYLYSDYNLPFYIYSLFDIDCKEINEKEIIQKITNDWQIEQIYGMLHNNTQLTLNKKQVGFIEKWITKQLKIIDFKKAITFNGVSWTTSYNAIYTDYFIRKLDLSVENRIYEDMLCFSWGENSDLDFSSLEFIERKLGSDVFKKKLYEFGKKDFLDGYVLSNRLKYCIKKDYDILFDCVIRNIANVDRNETDYSYSVYFEYLKNFGKLKIAYNYYDKLPINVKLELLHISFNQGIDNKIILDHAERYIALENEDSIKIAKALLPYSSLVALKYYYREVSKKGFELTYPYPTLKAYQDKKYFKILLKILALTYKYKDEDNRTRNDVMFCFEKMCIGSNLTTAKYIIKELNMFIKHSGFKDVSYLHYYLDGIKLKIITNKDD